jgi:hypothetical protein
MNRVPGIYLLTIMQESGSPGLIKSKLNIKIENLLISGALRRRKQIQDTSIICNLLFLIDIY